MAAAWADCVNAALEKQDIAERIDHRSYVRQGIDQIPTIHLGAAASQMEKRGIRTERGILNREIEINNRSLRQLKTRIGKLQSWLKEEQQSIAPTTLADYIQNILSRKAQAGKSSVSQSVYNLKDAVKMLSFLTANNIMDMAGLDEKFAAMLDEQMDIRDKLKPPVKAWKTEYATLTAEHRTLNGRYLSLKEKVKEAEQIRKSVYSILRQEQREQQPHKTREVEL